MIISNKLLGLEEEPLCSGVLVGDGWVLTAQHCFSDNQSTSKYRVLVGRDSRNAKKQGAAYGVARIVPAPPQNGVPTDAALLLLSGFESDRWSALPMAFEASLVNRNAGVTLFGYGNTGWNRLGEQAGSGTLHKSPDGAYVRSTACDRQDYICLSRVSTTRTMQGDSGAAWLAWEAGAWQVIGVHDRSYAPSGDAASREANVTEAWATSVMRPVDGYPSLRDWIREVASLPQVPSGSILRNPATGQSWLMHPDGYRRYIEAGGDYECLVSRGANVINMLQITIDTIPDRVGESARCGSRRILLLTDSYGAEGAPFIEGVLDSAGYEAETSQVLPDDLSPFAAVIHLGITELSDVVENALISFVESGGGLHLTGERPCCEALNASVQDIANALVVSVGGVVVGNQGDPYYQTGPLPMNPTAIGNLTTAPNQLSTWQPSAPGGLANVHGDNVLSSAPVNGVEVPVGAVWNNAGGKGRLTILMDVNWTGAGGSSYRDDPSATSLAENLALFLSGLSSPPERAPALLGSPFSSAPTDSDIAFDSSDTAARTG